MHRRSGYFPSFVYALCFALDFEGKGIFFTDQVRCPHSRCSRRLDPGDLVIGKYQVQGSFDLEKNRFQSTFTIDDCII